jgi:hypothetical protein
MASGLIRGTAIAAGVAAVIGLGIGYAVGEPVQATEILTARELPNDLCTRLGDVSTLLPPATTWEWQQTGKDEVICSLRLTGDPSRTFSAATLKIRATPYAGRAAGAGQPPFTPAEVAKQVYERKPWQTLPDQPYPTKLDKKSQTGGQSWRVSALVVRADLLVQVDYTAHPITETAAQQAVLSLADRAIWEAK